MVIHSPYILTFLLLIVNTAKNKIARAVILCFDKRFNMINPKMNLYKSVTYKHAEKEHEQRKGEQNKLKLPRPFNPFSV